VQCLVNLFVDAHIQMATAYQLFQFKGINSTASVGTLILSGSIVCLSGDLISMIAFEWRGRA
jgi:hypothetical protein